MRSLSLLARLASPPAPSAPLALAALLLLMRRSGDYSGDPQLRRKKSMAGQQPLSGQY
jgi:hypothetical protein